MPRTISSFKISRLKFHIAQGKLASYYNRYYIVYKIFIQLFNMLVANCTYV